METRVCANCGTEKPLDDYYSAKNEYGTPHKKCKVCVIEQARYKKLGICNVKYEEMLLSQHGACAICKCALNSSRYTKLCVDHDHKTGRVRGLLCVNCNTSIGLMKDSKVRLQWAMEYLHKHSVEEIV